MEQVKECGVDDQNNKAVSDNIDDDSGEAGDEAEAKLLSIQGRYSGPTRRSIKGGWTEEEDNILSLALQKFKAKSWKSIAENLPGRTSVQCLHRWQKVLDPNLVKGPWNKEEDDLLVELVREQGNKKWSEISNRFPGRIGKQCRERWHNHLNPEIKRSAWTEEEEATLIKLHEKYGNKWAEISKFLPGRTQNSIKNFWNCSVSKKLKLSPVCGSDLNISNTSAENRNSVPKQASLDPKTETSPVTCRMDLASENGKERESHLPTSGKNDCIENSSSPVTPPRQYKGVSIICQSPESVLRSAAKTYKNIPSIMRKRRLQTGNEDDRTISVEKCLDYAFDAAKQDSNRTHNSG
ncbi:hypothetical protein Ddye_017872 [Dipteronia dyeriana]|uniref:Uncharacterized protein n=1 Tax=Dipteronia dyeriana TaxID=168575 RepID=A0AAD9UA31_9ROSI|nr:hypothetical protein Ddye_017872 [Dipteronia dyeriana]